MTSGSNLGAWFWPQWAVLLGLIAVLYTQVVADMAADWWTEPSLSQGLLIPPLTLYIAWTRRKQTFAQPLVSDNRGLWLVACACVLYMLGSLERNSSCPVYPLLFCSLVWPGPSGDNGGCEL